MDSGNTSGSLQSSSGAEEEYDSRAESSSSLSAFLNHQQPPSLAPFTTNNLQNPLITHHHHQNTTHMFNPYMDPIAQTSTSLPNLDMMWSKTSRSESNHLDLIPSQHNQAFVSSQRGNSGAFPTLPPESGSRGLMLSVSPANNDQIQSNNTNNTNTNNMVRNPKKRSRASRRAPTTVLTTDTTNFRAMVQEFTGIPTPFTSSPFPRTRLDFFGSVAATTPTLRSNVNNVNNNNPLDNNPPTPPPYLLRPFPQKIQLRSLHHPFPPPAFSNNTLFVPSTNSTTNSTSINYQQQQLPEHFGLVKPPLSFNTVEAYPKYPFGNSSVLVSTTQQQQQQQPSLEIPPNLKMGVFEELRHDHVNTDLGCLHQNMVSSTSVGVVALSSDDGNNNNNNNINNNNNNLRNGNSSTEWAQRTSTITNNDCDHRGREGGGGLSGSVNYSDIAERVTNGNKVHFSASSLDFHGEKGQDFTVTARTQGMLESWINCSSD